MVLSGSTGCKTTEGDDGGSGVAERDPGARAREVLPNLEQGLEYRRHVLIGNQKVAALRSWVALRVRLSLN